MTKLLVSSHYCNSALITVLDFAIEGILWDFKIWTEISRFGLRFSHPNLHSNVPNVFVFLFVSLATDAGAPNTTTCTVNPTPPRRNPKEKLTPNLGNPVVTDELQS